MTKRLATLGRILAVQTELHRAAEWRLAALDRRQAELARTREDLACFLGEDHAFSGLFAASMAGRLRSLAAEIAETAQARRVQVEAVMREAGRAKRAERLAAALRREERRAGEARDLLDIVERAAGIAHASPP